MKKLWIVSLLLAFPGALAAQRVSFDRTPGIPFDERGQLYEKLAGEVRARVAIEGQLVSGAPYSAEAVTESTQMLADGNRINRKSVTRVYRDAEGRTRREDLDDAGNVISVSIVDPVAHLSYVLNPSSRTAFRDAMRTAAAGAGGMWQPMTRRAPEPGGSPETEAAMKVHDEQLARARTGMPMPPPPPPPPPVPGEGRALERTGGERGVSTPPTREDLGQQNIDGVNASGTRITTTIPAGAIGNVQPIKSVVEQWFSPDLKVLVMTRHSDPRSGETTYRLQSVVRAEPDRSLFTVPADYTVKESGIREPLPR